MAKVGTGYWWGSNFDAYERSQKWAAGAGWAWSPAATRDLAFKTWIVTTPGPTPSPSPTPTPTPTYEPPKVAADHTAVNVDEGTPASNTGTFSDPDANPVALSASSGILTKSGTIAGTWSWSALAADEGPPANQTVTVTANDGNGTSTVSFPVTVGGVAPIASIGAAGSIAPEGTAFR